MGRREEAAVLIQSRGQGGKQARERRTFPGRCRGEEHGLDQGHGPGTGLVAREKVRRLENGCVKGVRAESPDWRGGHRMGCLDAGLQGRSRSQPQGAQRAA